MFGSFTEPFTWWDLITGNHLYPNTNPKPTYPKPKSIGNP